MSGEKVENKRKPKGLTWAEASAVVLERSSCPMTHKEILKVIQDEKLRDASRGNSSLACLNAMLHQHSRGPDALFYKVDGRTSCYGINKKSENASALLSVKTSETQDAASIVTAATATSLPPTLPPPSLAPPTMSSSSASASTVSNQQSVELSDSEPSSPQACMDSLSDTSATNNAVQQDECPEPTNVVEVPDIQREETLTCVSPTEKDSTAFLPKATVNGTKNPAPKRPRPSSKSSKKDKKKASELKPTKQPPVKKPKPNSTRPRPVAKNVLKNLKVGTVGEMTESQTLGDSKLKKLVNSGLGESSLNGEAHGTPQIAAARNMVKFSGLHTKKQRRYKKMSIADQIKRTKEGRVDLQSPESILASVPLRSLLNNRTFQLLPPAYQYQLLMLLPKVDRVVGQDGGLRPSAMAFTNEFFTSTCHLWRDRLKDGEFTPEMQQKLKMEEEKLTKIDPWKAKYFEPVWGQKSLSRLDNDMLPLFPGLTPESDNSDNIARFWQPPSLIDRSLTNTSYTQSETISPQIKPEQLNSTFLPQLTVPIRKLALKGENVKQKRVGPLHRSPAAKSMSSKAKSKISAVSMTLTVDEITNALSAVRTSEPEDIPLVAKLLTRKKVLKLPTVEPKKSQSKSGSKSKHKNNPVAPITKQTEDINPALTLNSLSIPVLNQQVSSATASIPKDSYTSKSEVTSRPLTSLLPSNAKTVSGLNNALMAKSCVCRLKAMKVCRMCGAFCHDDCITAAQLCSMCVN